MPSTKAVNLTCIIIVAILGVALFISNIIFSFKYSEYDFEGNSLLKEIINNLNGKLIYSLLEKKECSADEKILTPLGIWGGSNPGCYCPQSTYLHKCSDDESKQGCKNIPSYPSKKYEKINGNYLCIKQSKESYKDLLENNKIISKNSLCPKDYVECGVVDTLGNKFCAENNESCPISIEYLNKTFIYNSQNENDYELFPLGINNLNKAESQILSVFQIGEDNICIYPGETEWEKSSILETTQVCRTNISNIFYDNRYEKISSIKTTKYDLYLDNNINSFIKGSKTVVYLYGRNFMGFEKGKISGFSYDSIINTQKLSNRCHNVMKILSIILLCFIGFPIFVIIGCVCGTGGHPPDIKCNEKECACVLMTAGIGALVTAIVSFVIDFILCIIVFYCSVKLKILLSIKASDSLSNELIQTLIDEASKNFTFSLVIVIIIFLAIIDGIILLINFCREGKIEF